MTGTLPTATRSPTANEILEEFGTEYCDITRNQLSFLFKTFHSLPLKQAAFMKGL